MPIIINNLDHRSKALMQLVWDMDDLDKVRAFMASLPTKDRIVIDYLIDVARAGGDEITDVTRAKQELDRIAHL